MMIINYLLGFLIATALVQFTHEEILQNRFKSLLKRQVSQNPQSFTLFPKQQLTPSSTQLPNSIPSHLNPIKNLPQSQFQINHLPVPLSSLPSHQVIKPHSPPPFQAAILSPNHVASVLIPSPSEHSHRQAQILPPNANIPVASLQQPLNPPAAAQFPPLSHSVLSSLPSNSMIQNPPPIVSNSVPINQNPPSFVTPSPILEQPKPLPPAILLPSTSNLAQNLPQVSLPIPIVPVAPSTVLMSLPPQFPVPLPVLPLSPPVVSPLKPPLAPPTFSSNLHPPDTQPLLSEESEFDILIHRANFNCNGKVTGFYVNIDLGCKVWHYCLVGTRYDHMCPPETLFSQEFLTCKFTKDVDCANSARFYERNNNLFVASDRELASNSV